jgi:IS30 family transposase
VLAPLAHAEREEGAFLCLDSAVAKDPDRTASGSGESRSQIADAISIRERPAEVEDRAIPGHWEGDLLSVAKNSYIATLVERRSRFVMLINVPSKETQAVVAALRQYVRKLPATLKHSLALDRVTCRMLSRNPVLSCTDRPILQLQ